MPVVGGARAPMPDEVRQKAIADLQLRRASGVPVSGVGEKYGVSDQAVYTWLRVAEGKKKPPKPQHTPEQKAAAVLEWANSGPDASVASVARKHKIPEGTLRGWITKVPKKKEAPQVNAKPAQKKTRKIYDAAFKARAVEDFIQRQPGVGAGAIAKKRGITEGRLYSWVRASRAGKLPSAPEPDRSAIVASPKSNGHAQLSAQLHLSMGEAPPPGQNGLVTSLPLQVQLYVQRLETQNKALRKMLQIAMEAI